MDAEMMMMVCMNEVKKEGEEGDKEQGETKE